VQTSAFKVLLVTVHALEGDHKHGDEHTRRKNMNAIQWVVLVGLIYKLNSIPTPKGKTETVESLEERSIHNLMESLEGEIDFGRIQRKDHRQ
jgi:hypothetical protein